MLEKNNDFLTEELKEPLFNELLDLTFLSSSKYFNFKKIYNIMKNNNMENKLIKILDKLIDEVYFNSYHYELLKFFNTVKIVDFNKDKLLNAIEKRRIIK